MEPHGQWRREIDIRNGSLTGDWWPFVENINAILSRLDEIENEFSDLENKVDETLGLIKGIYKSLHKLHFFDKERKLNWKAVELIGELLDDRKRSEEEEERRADGKSENK
jgi:hypothetical protein|tara:strand:+ start:13117 stop:13446 length:330 start_codon:yes stop_codon:yes gene_type:complete